MSTRLNEINLNIVRAWPNGFQDRLYKVWNDVIGYIPNVMLLDLQRTLAEFGFTMKVYEDLVEPVSREIKELAMPDPAAMACGWEKIKDKNRYKEVIIYALMIQNADLLKERGITIPKELV